MPQHGQCGEEKGTGCARGGAGDSSQGIWLKSLARTSSLGLWGAGRQLKFFPSQECRQYASVQPEQDETLRAGVGQTVALGWFVPTSNTCTPTQVSGACHLVPGGPVTSAFPLASCKSPCPLGPLRWAWLKGCRTHPGASRPYPLLPSVGRVSRKTTHMVLSPGEGPGDCRAGNCEDSVAPPWVVATCNSFWSWGGEAPCYLWRQRQKQTSDESL